MWGAGGDRHIRYRPNTAASICGGSSLGTTHWDGTTYQNTIVIHMYIHAHSNKQLHTDIKNIKTDDDDQMS